MSYVETLKQVRIAAQVAEEKKGEDIVAFDMRGQSSLADCYLLINGSSHIHIRAIEDAIRESLKSAGATLTRTDGQRGHLWRALDYGDFFIHLMDKKTREFYAMERLWERAKPIALNHAAAPMEESEQVQEKHPPIKTAHKSKKGKTLKRGKKH